jgi:hypothetical protein
MIHFGIRLRKASIPADRISSVRRLGDAALVGTRCGRGDSGRVGGRACGFFRFAGFFRAPFFFAMASMVN